MSIKKRAIKRCRIYQVELRKKGGIPDEELPKLARIAFRSYESAQSWCEEHSNSSIPSDIYTLMFDGQLETDNLEGIFRIFNLQHPAGYKGRSLSLSDIIELYNDTESTFYYCDTFGFTEISFDPTDAKPL